MKTITIERLNRVISLAHQTPNKCGKRAGLWCRLVTLRENLQNMPKYSYFLLLELKSHFLSVYPSQKFEETYFINRWNEINREKNEMRANLFIEEILLSYVPNFEKLNFYSKLGDKFKTLV